MCQAIDDLAGYHGAACFWLTDWTGQMRASMDPFPGPDWPSIAEPPAGAEAAREWAGDLWAVCPWWKWWALDQWLDTQPDLRRLVWVDDELRYHRDSVGQRGPSRRAWTIQTALHHAGVFFADDRVKVVGHLVVAGLWPSTASSRCRKRLLSFPLARLTTAPV